MSTTLRIRDALMAGPATLGQLASLLGHDRRALNGRLHQLRQSGRLTRDGDRWQLVSGAVWQPPRLPRGALQAQALATLSRGPKRTVDVAGRIERNPGTVAVTFRRLEAQGRVVRRGRLWMLPEHAARIEATERQERAACVRTAMQAMRPGSADYRRAQRTLAHLRAQA